jgi:hypothetical protein
LLVANVDKGSGSGAYWSLMLSELSFVSPLSSNALTLSSSKLCIMVHG